MSRRQRILHRLTWLGEDWIDRLIQWASGVAAVAMFAYGVALSYSVLHAVAVAAKLPEWAAAMWPLGFEAFMASAALNVLAEQRNRRGEPSFWKRVPWYPWTLTALTAGASIALNWFHPSIPLDPPPGWLVSLVYGLPPLVAVFAWHLFLQRVAHRRSKPAPVVPPAGVGERGQGVRPTVSPGPASRDSARAAEGAPGVTLSTPGAPPTPARSSGVRSPAREQVRSLVARERSGGNRVTAPEVMAATGISQSRAFELLKQVRGEAPEPGRNGHAAEVGA